MSLERMPGPMGAEPAPPATAAGGREPSPAALQLQVLATEHWGLLATRSLAWNESFTRAAMFLSALSGAIVALALVAQATAFGDGFFLFAIAVLPIVLFIGLASFVRMGRTNYYDALCVIGMNRIRHAYLQLTPEVEPFLVMGTHDDIASVDLSMGAPPRSGMLSSVIVSTPFVVGIINSVLGGVIAAIVIERLSAQGPWSVVAGVIGFFVVFGLQTLAARSDIQGTIADFRPKFPAPSSTSGGAS